MKWPHWLEGCRGSYVSVSHTDIARYKGTKDPELALGAQTRPIARCDTCHRLFATETLPGKWSLEQLNEMREGKNQHKPA